MARARLLETSRQPAQALALIEAVLHSRSSVTESARAYSYFLSSQVEN